MRLDNHTLPAKHFEDLAHGDGNPEALSILRSAEYSRRLLLLRVFLDMMADRPDTMGPLPPAERAWEVLAEAWDSSPEALAAVLASPQVGVWLSRMVRILRYDEFDQRTIWTETGHVHAVAFAVAMRAGMTMSTGIPLRDGGVLVPTLGMAHIPLAGQHVASADTSQGRARVRCADYDIEIPDDPRHGGHRWWNLRAVALPFRDRTVDVSLDDIDRYRNFDEPIAERRLDGAEHERWTTQLTDAWRVLETAWPQQRAAMAAGLLSIVPLPEGDGREIRSASTGDGFGAALLSPHPDAVTLAASLVHEFQHIKLGSLLHLIPLVDQEMEEKQEKDLVYAPWRDDPRPVSGLLQGVYAFLGISEFWRRQRGFAPAGDRAAAEFEFAYARRQANTGLRTLLGSELLTPHGRDFGRHVARRLRDHLAEKVPAQAVQAAWATATEHRAAWRIRHLAPLGSPALADAFLARRPPQSMTPVATVLRPARGTRWYQSRLALYRLRLAHPDEFAELARGDAPLPPQAHSTVPSDIALVSGDATAAEVGYRSLIDGEPGNLAGWTGLVLAASANRSTPAWRVLTRRPELVRAVHLALRRRAVTVQPTAVAEWLEQAPIRWLAGASG
jgi:HEXXH motif-containing protein